MRMRRKAILSEASSWGTVADFIAETLGSQRDADRGFDLEIWNELSLSNVHQQLLRAEAGGVQGRGHRGRVARKEIVNSVGMRLVFISAGEFTMNGRCPAGAS